MFEWTKVIVRILTGRHIAARRRRLLDDAQVVRRGIARADRADVRRSVNSLIIPRVVTGLESGLNGVGFISNILATVEKSLFGVDQVRG